MNDHVTWRTSSYTGETGNCVEVASLPDGDWWVRDTKNRAGPTLQVPADQWAAFQGAVRTGQFD